VTPALFVGWQRDPPARTWRAVCEAATLGACWAALLKRPAGPHVERLVLAEGKSPNGPHRPHPPGAESR
jgi:hypothetical protein